MAHGRELGAWAGRKILGKALTPQLDSEAHQKPVATWYSPGPHFYFPVRMQPWACVPLPHGVNTQLWLTFVFSMQLETKKKSLTI